MAGLAILLAFNLLGLALQKWARVPLPGNVIGLVLFTACLFAGVVKLEWVEGAAQFLLRHMLLFFAPVIVGVIAFEALLRREWLAVTVGLVGSWLAVLLATGWSATLLIRNDGEGRR
jgi:holin-like protein